MHQVSFFLLLGFFCLFVASREESPNQTKETDRVRVADEELLKDAETVETRFARSSDRDFGRTRKGGKGGAQKKKKKENLGRNTRRKIGGRGKRDSKKKDNNSDSNGKKKRQRKGKKTTGRRQERKKKQSERLRKEGRMLVKKGKKDKVCPPPTSTRTVSGSRAINETCLANIIKIVETYYKQVKNFQKQWKRIESKNKTSVSKGGKMDAFKKPLERLVEAGGGNVSNLGCQGSTTSPGALQMQNLSSILTNCSADIKDACSESQKPTINMTEVDKCNAMIAEFEMSVTGTDGCLKKTGEELCNCFGNQSLLDQAAVLRKCSLATESKEMATALKTCKGKYGDCRKYKEDIIDIVSACSKPLDKQKEKAKALAENVDSIKAAQGAVASVTGSGRRHFFKDRFSFNYPSAFSLSTKTMLISGHVEPHQQIVLVSLQLSSWSSHWLRRVREAQM